MKKQHSTQKTAITALLVLVALTSATVAQDAALQELKGAAEALAGGSEARAWQIYTQNEAAFMSQWKTLDKTFVAWVADQYRKQKRYDNALGLCNRILADEKSLDAELAASVLLVKGDVFRDRENYAAARLEYQSIDRHKTYRGTDAGKQAGFRIVDILRVTKNYDGAEEIIERLLDYPDLPTQAEAYFLRARIAFDRESYEEAREYIDEVKKRIPEHIEALFLEAELNLREDRLQDPELEIGSRVLMTYVVPGRPITMKMQDRNLAIVRGGAGIPVSITTSKGGDAEVISLLPSPRDPTLFRGNLSTKLGEAAASSLTLEVTGIDIVSYNMLESFQKENELKYEPKTMLVVADAELTVTSGDFISSEERDTQLLRRRLAALQDENLKAYERTRDTNVIRPGNEIRVQVIDYDQDVGSDLDQVFVSAKTSSGDHVDGVSLEETEPHSGIFRGEIRTTTAPPRATVSDSAKGSNPGSAISETGKAAWRSGARAGDKEKWFEVDLMTMHPLAVTALDFVDPANVKRASLYASSDETFERVASTEPSKEEVFGYVDLAKHFGEQIKTAGYVYTEIVSDIAREATLKIGSCDGVVCWLNGERVHLNLGGRSWTPEEDVVTVKLQGGVNSIFMRVTQVTGPWGVSLTVLDAAGSPLDSMETFPPAQAGVVTSWFVFDRLTPEEIKVGKRIDVRKPIRILGDLFEWVLIDVTPPASLTIEGSMLKTVFHRSFGTRRLRWTFDEFAGNSVSVKDVSVINKFDEILIPAEVEFSTAATNRTLELGPGDVIDVTYEDKRRVRAEPMLLDRMRAGFYNAHVMLAYETIEIEDDGERLIVYDPAVRYRAAAADRLVVVVTDHDADSSADLDRVKVLVENSDGEQIWIEALETEEHSGRFIEILRLGTETGGDTIKAGPDIAITASYSDRENSDGVIERKAVVKEAADDPPELLLYQAVVIEDKENLRGDDAEGPIVRVQLPHVAEGEENEPVVTSLDTSLIFKVVYPQAALSSNAVFEAQLITARDIASARDAGAEPEYLSVNMRLSDAHYAEFSASVPIRIGERGDYADDLVDEEGAEDEDAARPLYVRGDDIVHVFVRDLASQETREGRYRLASDAVIDFTDNKYQERVDSLYLGDFVYVRVSDRDRDVSDELDHLSVELAAKDASKTLELTETLPHSGLFTSRVKTGPALAAAAGEAANTNDGVFRVAYNDRIKGSYDDRTSVIAKDVRRIGAVATVYPGADGSLATFTKRFRDEEIAVKTRLLTAEALFELAKDHRDTDQKDLADQEIAEGKVILEEAIADYPDTKHAPHAEFLLANLAQELEKYDEALERYNRVLASWPDSEYAPRSQLKKGICLEKLKDFDNALDAYVELTYSYPSDALVADAVVRLGQHFYRTKEYQVAGKIFSNFHDNHPEHELAAKALFLSGQSYMKGAEERKQELDGRYDVKAEEWLEAAIERFEQLAETYDNKDLRSESMYWQADCHMKLRDMKGAYLTFKKLTWDYPESKWAKFARGQLVQNAAVFDRVKED